MSELPPVTLYPSKRKWVALAALCALFVTGGVLAAGEPGGWMGYLGAGFFGLGLVLSLINLWPGASWLRLDEHGVTWQMGFRGGKTIAWDEIRDVCSGRWNYSDWVFFNQISVSNQLTRLNAMMLGRNAMFPDNFGKKAAELAELVERYRRAYSKRS